MENENLTHLDAKGSASMVDVGAKNVTERRAIAQGIVRLADKTMQILLNNDMPKGDVLACARIGAIMGAKRTSELIPLCHPVPLNLVKIDFEINKENNTIKVISEARCNGRTGVEMEAIIAAQCACAIIYDMVKAVQRDVVIDSVKLLYKSGGKSGEFRAKGFNNVDS